MVEYLEATEIQRGDISLIKRSAHILYFSSKCQAALLALTSSRQTWDPASNDQQPGSPRSLHNSAFPLLVATRFAAPRLRSDCSTTSSPQFGTKMKRLLVAFLKPS